MSAITDNLYTAPLGYKEPKRQQKPYACRNCNCVVAHIIEERGKDWLVLGGMFCLQYIGACPYCKKLVKYRSKDIPTRR